MKRTFLLLYLAFLVLFTINVMNKPEPEEVTLPDLVMSMSGQSKYVLPKTPVFSIQNNTQSAVDIDNCTNIEIRMAGALRPLPEDLCRTTTIEPGETMAVLGDQEGDMQLFQRLGGSELEFTLVYQSETTDIRKSTDVQIVKPGTFRKFFREVFFRPVYNFFVFLIEVLPGHSLGLGIIAITLIIRIILLVPQQKIMISQRKLQAIQPKIQAIQKQYKNDQAQLGMKIMELYRKEKVNPMGSFLPLFIQIPLLIVLYWSIRGIEDPVNYYHLYNISFFQDFKSVVINTNFLGIDLKESGGTVGLILAIVVAFAQFVQMKLSQIRNEKKNPKKKEKKKPKNPDEPEMPDMQQVGKVMVYFLPIMVAFFTYQFPAGVGMYWLIGTVFMIFQQAFVNKLLDKKSGKPTVLDEKGNEIA